MENKIRAVFILEALGRPPEHVKEKLESVIDKLKKEENVEVMGDSIAKPRKAKDSKKLFTSFAEVEIETNLQKLLALVLAYMPSNIDIITPEKIQLKNSDLNSILNQITQKLHRYDEIAKTVMMERKQLANKIKSGEIEIKKKGGKNKGSNNKRKDKKD